MRLCRLLAVAGIVASRTATTVVGQAPPPEQPPEEEVVADFYVEGDEATGMDCTAIVETIGCFTDAKYTAHSGRDLPYNLPGCFSGDPPGFTKTAPTPPPCSDSLMTNAYCAKLCLDWSVHIPDAEGDLFASTQAGFACFCGLVKDTEIVLETAEKSTPPKRLALASCSDPCKGDPSGGQALTKGGYKHCGGESKNLIMRVRCNSNWGWWLLGTLSVGSLLYVGGTMAYTSQTGGAAQLPHRAFWSELGSLAIDGVAFCRMKLGGGAGPQGMSARGGGGGGYESIPAKVKPAAAAPAPSTTGGAAGTGGDESSSSEEEEDDDDDELVE
jgi:hypothetical protein